MIVKSLKFCFIPMVSIGLLFTGCGENSDEAKAYNIEQWLDSGDNQKVINYLGDCSSKSGIKKEECFLNVGAAYFGKANFDMISLSKEFSDINDSLNDDAKSKAFNNIIFSKLDDDNLKEGITFYENIVDGNSSVCNEKNYNDLNKNQKQACLSINPMLISNIVDDDNDSNKSEISVSIKDIIEFKNVLQNAVPELESSDLVAILSGDALSSDKDEDGDGVLDTVQATNIVLKKVNNATNNAAIIDTQTNVYTHAKLSNVDYHEVQLINNGKKYYRLTQAIANINPVAYTILTTKVNQSCDANNSEIAGTINGTSIFPCAKLKDDGNVTSLNDSVTGILNNDTLLNSIALASESEDDTKSDANKIKDFKNDVCDITGTATAVNNGNCTVDAAGKITITQEALIEYMTEAR